MNYSFFLIFIISVGFIPFAFADTTGYDYFDIVNPDGTHTWRSHEPYIFDGYNYVPFIATGTQIQTVGSTVTLNPNGSFTWNSKLTDNIVAKYADISNLTAWTYPNTLNNDVPDVSWNGTTLTSSKTKSAIGQLDYKYVLTNGKWKTQLEATNLSSLTTKVFGFDQIIDLNSDSIRFGGVTRNLDNFNNTTFDKEFLMSNQGKIIDLLNGIYFDFDLGFENLYSITVYDTGANKSRLVFDYRTDEILWPGETLIIDPTYGFTAASDAEVLFTGLAAAATCDPVSSNATLATSSIGTGPSGAASRCWRLIAEWNVDSIVGAAGITSVTLQQDLTVDTNMLNCDVYYFDDGMGNLSLSDKWDRAGGTGSTVVLTDDTFCASNATDLDVDVSAAAANVLATLNAGDSYLGFAIRGGNDPTREAGERTIAFNDMQLEIVYTLPPLEFEVDLDTENVGDALRISGSVLINSFYSSANVTNIIYYINGTTISTNATGQNFTSYPSVLNFGPFWYQQTTDSIYNHTVAVAVQDYLFDIDENSTSSLITREYDPDYFTAIDPTQGLVNYTFDGDNFININRDTGGIVFNVECQYFTQAQAFFDELDEGTWENETGVLFYVEDTSGFYYMRCFNDGELFVIAIPQNYTNALVPGLLIFDQLGGFFGAPSIILVIISILSLGTGRNYPIIMLIAASVTGILLALELLTLDPGLVVAIIVMTGFGLFGIRKFY